MHRSKNLPFSANNDDYNNHDDNDNNQQQQQHHNTDNDSNHYSCTYKHQRQFLAQLRSGRKLFVCERARVYIHTVNHKNVTFYF